MNVDYCVIIITNDAAVDEQPSMCDAVVGAILSLQENTVTTRPGLLTHNCEPDPAPKLKIKNCTLLHRLDGVISIHYVLFRDNVTKTKKKGH